MVFYAPLQRVHRNGPRLLALECEDGTIYRGRVFLDATIEGDLLALAGVEAIIGRKPNARYGESKKAFVVRTPTGNLPCGLTPTGFQAAWRAA